MKADQEFEALRRLLKLKRHEQPPPRFFNELSGEIIARLRAGSIEDRREPMDRVQWESPLLARIIDLFQTKPVFAGVFGAAMCGLLLAGVLYSQKIDSRPPTLTGLAGPTVAEATDTQTSAFVGTTGLDGKPGTVTNSIFDLLQPTVPRNMAWPAEKK